MTDPTPLALADIIAGNPEGTNDPHSVYRWFRDTFETPSGRRVLHLICREAGLFDLNEAAFPPDMLRDRSGRQHLARWILAKAMVPPPAPVQQKPPTSLLDKP
jgi:hypothetical protein